VTAWSRVPLVVGHRGGRGTGWPPENTLACFERSRGEGAIAVELDVRVSADDVCVVFHDPALTRMTARRDTRSIATVSFDELHRIDLGGGATVPSLEEVLAWASDYGIAVNIELKHDVPSRLDVARAVRRALRRSRADVLISSFDPLLLAMSASLSPRTPRALLTHAAQARWADLLQQAARPPLVGALHVERAQIDAVSVARFVSRGLRVGAWTVNDPVDAVSLVRAGVASIITDRPGEVLAALRS
jgi:glycerophosphoryl diester phosphodiesterase